MNNENNFVPGDACLEDGTPARIYAVDGSVPYRIHGAYLSGWGWVIASWSRYGKCQIGTDSKFDLKPNNKLESKIVWLVWNQYNNVELLPSPKYSALQTDKAVEKVELIKRVYDYIGNDVPKFQQGAAETTDGWAAYIYTTNGVHPKYPIAATYETSLGMFSIDLFNAQGQKNNVSLVPNVNTKNVWVYWYKDGSIKVTETIDEHRDLSDMTNTFQAVKRVKLVEGHFANKEE